MDAQRLQYIFELIKQGDGAKLTAEDLNLLKEAADKSSESLKKHGEASGEAGEQLKELGAKAAETLAVLGVTVGIEKMIEKYSEATMASANLDAALRANGQLTAENSASLNELAEAKAKVTTSSKEQYQASEALLITYGLQAAQMPEVMRGTADLAAMMGVDLHTAAFEVAKAFDGETTALKRLGFSFDGTVTSGDRLSALLAQIQQKAGGMAEAFAATPAGQMLKLKAEAAELEVALGGMVTNALLPTVRALSELAAGITGAVNHGPELRELGTLAFGAAGQIGAIAAVGKLLEVTFTNVGEDGVRHFRDLGEAVKGVPTAIQIAVVAALVIAVKETSEKYLASVEAEGQQIYSEAGLQKQNSQRRAALEKMIEDSDMAEAQKENLQQSLAGGFAEHRIGRASGKSGRGIYGPDLDAQREALRQVTEALNPAQAPMSEKDQKASVAEATTQKEQKQGLLEIDALRKSAWMDQLDQFAKERAAIDAKYQDDLTKLTASSRLAKLSDEDQEKAFAELRAGHDKLIGDSIQKQADAQTAADGALTMEQARLEASTLTGYAKLRAEENIRYQEQVAHILALRDLQGKPIAAGTQSKMLATAASGHDAAEHVIDKTITPEAQHQIRMFEDEMTSTMIRGKETRVQNAEDEYKRRLEFYQQLKNAHAITEDVLTQLTADAGRKRGRELASAAGEGQADADRLILEATRGTEQAKTDEINRQFKVRKQLIDLYYNYEVQRANGNATAIVAIEQQRTVAEAQLEKQRAQATSTQYQLMVDVGRRAESEFAGGMANAMVSFISGTKSAKQAFSEFAASFLQDIAKMIMELEIMALIKAIAGLGGGLNISSSSINSGIQPASIGGAQTGPMFAAAGIMGITNGTTFLPKHNVIAGEEGEEALAVLANPHAAMVGNIQAMIGSVRGNRMAIVDANDLMRLANVRAPVMAATGILSNPSFFPTISGGQGGTPTGGNGNSAGGSREKVEIEIQLGRNLVANVINAAVEAASLRVVNDLNTSTPTSTSARNLSR